MITHSSKNNPLATCLFSFRRKLNIQHKESWLPLSGPRRRLLLQWMGHNVTGEQSQMFSVFLTQVSALVYARSHSSYRTNTKATKSWFLVLLLVVGGKGRGVVLFNSRELRFPDSSYHCKQLVHHGITAVLFHP